ncbi:PP2C family protein-serine/threonine phosphatase [Streptomyces sp. NPDC051907]|uniref:PP2C family protein-serine/threonine phosphatase n=1 Tax=Streptomyces sp. NPDC051907 TaxID=3155284 RepID=UPI00342FD4BC
MSWRRRLADLRQPWQPSHAWLAIPLGLIVAIAVVDVLAPGDIHLGPLLIVAPAITPWFAGPWLTGLVGALAVAAQAIIAVLRDRDQLFSTNHQVQIAALASLSLVIVVFCHQRQRRIRQLDQVRSVAEATQRVVLRPLPHRMGPLRIASAYRAADDEALIGGDLYAATRTENGTRLLIGDVRGKGMNAISDASVIMGAFREAAYRSASLAELVATLEDSIRRHLTEHAPHSEADELYEQFVTALLLEIPDEDPVAGMINCGHPPPLLLHDHQVSTLHPRHAEPPLGIFDLPRTGLALDPFTFEEDDSLLLYTDGLIEARSSDGSFYPLAQRVAQWADSGPEALLHRIRTDLAAHVGGQLNDDAAAVVIQRSPRLDAGGQLKKIAHITGPQTPASEQP